MNETASIPQYSLKPGWICFVLAVIVTAIFGPLGLIVGGPLMLVCVILSIIGMAKNNTGGGIALLLSSLFFIPAAFLVWMFVVAATLTLSEMQDSEGPGLSASEPDQVMEESEPVSIEIGPGKETSDSEEKTAEAKEEGTEAGEDAAGEEEEREAGTSQSEEL